MRAAGELRDVTGLSAVREGRGTNGDNSPDRDAAPAELAILSRSLGHAELSTTADTYGHVTPAMGGRSAARIDGVLAG